MSFFICCQQESDNFADRACVNKMWSAYCTNHYDVCRQGARKPVCFWKLNTVKARPYEHVSQCLTPSCRCFVPMTDSTLMRTQLGVLIHFRSVIGSASNYIGNVAGKQLWRTSFKVISSATCPHVWNPCSVRTIPVWWENWYVQDPVAMTPTSLAVLAGGFHGDQILCGRVAHPRRGAVKKKQWQSPGFLVKTCNRHAPRRKTAKGRSICPHTQLA